MLKSRIDLFQLLFCPAAEFPVVREAVGVPHLNQVAICIPNLISGSAALKAKCPQGIASSAQIAGSAKRSAAFTLTHAPSIPPGRKPVNANRPRGTPFYTSRRALLSEARSPSTRLRPTALHAVHSCLLSDTGQVPCLALKPGCAAHSHD